MGLGSAVAASAEPSSQKIREARSLMHGQKWSEALVVLKSLSPDQRLSPEVAIELSRTLTYLGRREEAVKVLIAAIERQDARDAARPVLLRRLRVLASMFLESRTQEIFQDAANQARDEKYKAAQALLERAAELEPDNVEVLKLYGRVLLELRDADSAAEKLRLARNLDPYDFVARLWLGKALFARGETNLALDELRIAAKEMPGDEMATVALADALLATGRLNESLRLLIRDTRDYPSHLHALAALAQLRMRRLGGQKEMLWEARKELQLGLSRFPEVYPGHDAETQTAKQLRTNLLNLLQEAEERIMAR